MTAKLTTFLTLSQALYHARQSAYMRAEGPNGLDHAPRVILDAADTIRRAADKLHRIAEARCNGVERYDAAAGRVLASWGPEDERMADAAETRAQGRILTACANLFGVAETWSAEMQRDPRGASITLRLFVDGPSEPAREFHF